MQYKITKEEKSIGRQVAHSFLAIWFCQDDIIFNNKLTTSFIPDFQMHMPVKISKNIAQGGTGN
jgi:hypothetical protein